MYGPGIADTIVDISHGLIGTNLRQQITVLGSATPETASRMQDNCTIGIGD